MTNDKVKMVKIARGLRNWFDPFGIGEVYGLAVAPGFVRFHSLHPGLGIFNPSGILKTRSNRFECATRWLRLGAYPNRTAEAAVLHGVCSIRD